MKTHAAVLHEQPGLWQISEVEIDEPQPYEVLVRFAATGLCHSDDHYAKGDLVAPHLPFCAGHEGAGVVEKVGSAVQSLAVGDHVVTSFIPSCGRCRWCASGMLNLCDTGFREEGKFKDGAYRMHDGDRDIAQSCLIGCFAERTVMSENSCIKIDPDIPLQVACLLSCGVPTGWGSAVNAAAVAPGDVVMVVGTGGIGMNALQGARHAGASVIVAVDVSAYKQEHAMQFGATHAFATIDDAMDLLRSSTNGQGADAAIVSVGLPTGEHVAAAMSAVRKAGTVVLTGCSRDDEVGLPVNLFELGMFQKRIQGTLFGHCSPPRDIPRLAAFYQNGQLLLDELVTRTYSLDEINKGYADMHGGETVRGVILFD